MIKISYYKTTQDKIPKAFCMLAEKCYHNNISVFAYTNNEKSTAELDKVLWTYSKKQFIPHGTIHDPLPEKQPILLGAEFKNLNNASSMIIINADEDQLLSILSRVDKCERLFFVYDENEIALAKDIKAIVSTSALGEFKFESYVQEANGNWVGDNK